MSRQTIKSLVILICILLALYWLYPTYVVERTTTQEKQRLELEGKLGKLESKAIKRGLDLLGGMHLVLEVDVIELLDKIAKNKDQQFNDVLNIIKVRAENSNEDLVDLVANAFHERNLSLARYFGETRQSEAEVRKYLAKQATDAVDRSLEILRNRVDQFGVSEPAIQKQAGHRIIVELPGVRDPRRAKDLIGKTALLEFRMLKDKDVYVNTMNQINEDLKRNRSSVDSLAIKTSGGKPEAPASGKAEEGQLNLSQYLGGGETPTTAAGPDSAENLAKLGENPLFSILQQGNFGEVVVDEKKLPLLNKILDRPDVKRLLPNDSEFLFSNDATDYGTGKYYTLYMVRKDPELTGSVITKADAVINSGTSARAVGEAIVTLSMDRDGARVWSRLTGANIGKRLAIVLDRKVHSAPTINSKIPNGNSVIEGMRSMDEAKDLAIVLRAGALPAPVKIIEERTVGPALGQDSIRQGTTSALIGLALVVVFMLVYYKFSGGIANFALTLNVLFLLGVMANFGFTLTLPGIAGIILTIGMAVDANVLIFERIREELKSGKTLRASVDIGYGKAFWTIFDSNLTTLITAVVLYQFGTGPIRGFAVTLTIGIIISMFTAIFVTRIIFDYLISRKNVQTLSI